MITVALDLSIDSTGILIADSDLYNCTFVRLTNKSYSKNTTETSKFKRSNINGIGIADAISKLLLPYRYQQITVIIESIGFNYFQFKSATSSILSLTFESAIVASTLTKLFNANVEFVEPARHKKLFTGNGRASKEQSIAQMLHWFPNLCYASDKMDDMADAMSIMTTKISDIRFYTPKIICI